MRGQEKGADMRYEILDDFLSSEDLNYFEAFLRNLNPSLDRATSFYGRKSWAESQNTLPKEKILELEKKYLPIAMEILQKLAPHKVDLVQDITFNLQSTPPNFSYPIHLDSNQKVLSGVIYLHPNSSTGTFLHENVDDINGKEIPWQVNRAFFFSRTPSDSWHSYRGDGLGFRWVLVFNLLTFNLRKHEIRDQGLTRYLRNRVTQKYKKGIEK
jgi:hypothetical protein